MAFDNKEAGCYVFDGNNDASHQPGIGLDLMSSVAQHSSYHQEELL